MRKVVVLYDEAKNEIRAIDSSVSLWPAPTRNMYEELPEVSEPQLGHKQLIELIDKGLTADDIIELYKQGVI